MPLDATAQGVYVIAATPFHDDGRIDEASTDRMVDFFGEAGCTGITVLGQMGEAPKLDHDEALSLTSHVIRRAGKMEVIVGVTAPGFAAMRALARSAMEAGAAGVMIAPPSSLRTDDQIVTYYRQAAEAIGADVPFVIQDYPLSFSVVMTPAVIRLQKAGRRDEAHDLFDAHLPLIRYEQQPGAGLAVRKYVLKRRGILASEAQRKPGGTLSPAARAEVDYLLS